MLPSYPHPTLTHLLERFLDVQAAMQIKQVLHLTTQL